MFSKFIDIVVAIYTFPVYTWRGGCTDGSKPVGESMFGPQCETGFYQSSEKVAAVFIGIVIYGITIIVLLLVTAWVWDEVKWLRNRQRCQHCERWTVEASDGSNPGCIDGQACCDDCYEQHLDEAIERRAQTEARIECPHCGQQMDKLVEHRTILDVCVCGAVFLSPEEFEHLQALASERGYDDGYQDGKSVGSTNGMLVGVLIGNSFD